MARQNIDTLDDLVAYLVLGINNRRRAMIDLDAAGPPTEGRRAELVGEIRAFQKVLQILDSQLNVETARGTWSDRGAPPLG